MADEKLARRVLEVIPPSMARIRDEMRKAAPPELTTAQFRILGSVYRGRNLVGEIAQHHGVSQPAMSKMVEVLVAKGLIERDLDARGKNKDKRQVPLRVTSKGTKIYLTTRRAVRKKIHGRLQGLNPRQRAQLVQGLDLLEHIFLIKKRRSK